MKQFPPKSRNAIALFLPLAYMVMVLVFDWYEPYGTVTPPLLAIGLLLFSTILTLQWMLCWAFIYILTVSAVFMIPSVSSVLNAGHPITDSFSRDFRLFGFVITALFACYFSYLLGRLRSSQSSLNHLVAALPLPVILSDQEGKITMLNNAANAFMKIDGDWKKASLNYFDLLAPKMHRAKCIAHYLQAFQLNDAQEITIELEYDGKPLTGHIELLPGRKHEMITILTESSALEEPRIVAQTIV
jgi:PAS domain-containing protein